jgi:integrase
LLGEIRTAISKKTFNPADYDSKAKRYEVMVDKWIVHKIAEYRRGALKPSSLYSIQKIVANHLCYFSGYNVKDINLELVSDFVDNLQGKIKTRRNILIVLKSFLRWCYERGAITVMPLFPHIEGDDAKERVALNYEDQQELLRRIPEAHRDIIEFGMETGLRTGELITLQVRDIDLSGGVAYIRRTLSGNVVVETTKGGTKRHIPLSERAIMILTPHMAGKTPTAWLFVHPATCLRYGVNALNEIWKRSTGLDVTYYEASRHSFVTQCVDSGADALQVKELARHSDVRTTQRYYHGDIKRLRDVVNRRGRVIQYSFSSGPQTLDSRE